MLVPAGRHLCFSIRLRSRVTLQLTAGAVIVAPDPARHPGRYHLPEDGVEQLYHDFGHSHWQNSLIWGDDVHDVAIVGPGLIHGLGQVVNRYHLPRQRCTSGAQLPALAHTFAGSANTTLGRVQCFRSRLAYIIAPSRRSPLIAASLRVNR